MRRDFILTDSVEVSSVKNVSLFIPFLRPPFFFLSGSFKFFRNVAFGIGFDYLQIGQLVSSLFGLDACVPPRMWSD